LNIELIITYALLKLKSEVKLLYLSYLWWLIEPVLYIAAFYFVFEILLDRGGENFISFLLLGTVSFIWLSKTISVASNSIVQAQSIISHISINAIIFPLVSILLVFIKQLPVIVMLVALLVLQGFYPSWHWVNLIPVFVLHLLLIISFSLMASILVVLTRDVSLMISPALMFVMFTSGVFFDYRNIDSIYHGIFLSNPFAFIITSYRDIILYNENLNYEFTIIFSLIFILMIFIEIIIFNKYKSEFVASVIK